MDIKQFDEWWDKNEKQFAEDSMHMSQYHMASIVWEAAIESLRNQLSTNTWEPIETAPKKGEFLAYRNGKIHQCEWVASLYGEEMALGGNGWSFPKESMPTHWMPLLSAPTHKER